MEIINLTPFEFAPIVGRVGFPNHSISLIVKATFDMQSGQQVVESEEQLYPTGCEPYEDDDNENGSMRYDSDFAFYKPHADLLLAGNCYAPNEQSVVSCRVSFQVGRYTKSLAVFGNRYWQGIMQKPTTPEPFKCMPLRFENSYGGIGFPLNPVGKGYSKIQLADGSSCLPLPNVESMTQFVNSPANRPMPTSFAPLGQMWRERAAKLGTYGGAWAKERWPWFPDDLDWSYFNAASSDMQVKGYLKGDEDLFIENMHPHQAQYQSKLPGIRIRLFFYEANSQLSNDSEFKEINMNLDTLWVDMEDEKLVLVWRGISQISSSDYEEIENIFIVSEKLESDKQSVNYYRTLFLQELAKENADDDYEIEDVEKPSHDVDIETELAQAKEEMREAIIAAGLDPDNPPEKNEEEKAAEKKLIQEYGLEDDEELEWSRERVIIALKQGGSFDEEDLHGLDLSSLDFSHISFIGANMSGANLKNTNLSNSMLTSALLENADLSKANLCAACLKEADLTGSNLIASDLTEALLDDAIFDKVNMHRAILDRAHAKDTQFTDSIMTESLFRGSVLDGADFSKSSLDRANFQNASLKEASFSESSCIQVNMQSADLSLLRATGGSNFTQANLYLAKGLESNWAEAILIGADLSYSDMETADFGSADLTSANLSAANMKFAKLTKANMSDAICLKMNLFQGSLEGSNLAKTDFSGSNLYGVEFLDAIFAGTNFRLSNLKMTKLEKRV